MPRPLQVVIDDQHAVPVQCSGPFLKVSPDDYERIDHSQER